MGKSVSLATPTGAVRAAEQIAHGAPLFVAREWQFFQATMHPLFFSKSRAFEERAHGGLRVIFVCGKTPRCFRAMSQRRRLSRCAGAWESLCQRDNWKRVGPPVYAGVARSRACAGWAADLQVLDSSASKNFSLTDLSMSMSNSFASAASRQKTSAISSPSLSLLNSE